MKTNAVGTSFNLNDVAGVGLGYNVDVVKGSEGCFLRTGNGGMSCFIY